MNNRASVELVCRGSGKFYVRVRMKAQKPFSQLHYEAAIEGVPCPSQAYPLTSGESGADQKWVLALPIAAGNVAARVWPDERKGEATLLAFNGTAVKWLSRLNYRLRGDGCQQLRDFEQTHLDGSYQVHMVNRFEADDGVIWRFAVEWIGDASRRPIIQVRGEGGDVIDAELFFFEFSEGDGSAEVPNELNMSARVPRGCGPFSIVAIDEGGVFEPGFAHADAELDAHMAGAMANHMKSARDDATRYREWLSEQRVQPEALEWQSAHQIESAPLLSVVLAGEGDGADVSRSMSSVRAQSHCYWELLVPHRLVAPMVSVGDDLFDRARRIRSIADECALLTSVLLSEAAGDYLVFLACGDMLEPDALYEIAAAITEHDNPGVLYCDSDTMMKDGSFGQPVFRTQLDVDALYTGNWIGDFVVVKRELLADIAPDDAHAGAYNVSLHALEQEASFVHVPRMLHHAHMRSEADVFGSAVSIETAQVALQEHFDRRGIKGAVEVADDYEGLRMRYELPSPHPLVSIIIPNKDHVDLLEGCIRSIIDKATYDAYEIVIVENNSDDDETFAYYERIQQEQSCVRVITWPEAFNFSKIVNFGAREAKGEYLLILNNDTEVMAPDFIEEMLGYLQRPEVGIVGAKLLFRDGLIQHAGMLVGAYDALVHVNQNFTPTRRGYLDRAVRPGTFTAMTGACQMMRKSTFEEIGGYDEELVVGFNDGDFCMRVWEAGLRVVLAPRALLHHFEFATRGREAANSAKMVRWKQEQEYFMKKWPLPFQQGDPFTNPNLVRDNGYYRL